MDWLRFWEILAIAICLGAVARVCWLLSEEPKFWLWKHDLHILTALLAAAGLFTVGIAQHVFEMGQPLSATQGRIEVASLRSHTFYSHSEHSYLKLRTDAGELLSLDAPGWSIYFQQGQWMRATYEGSTGVLVSAQFLSDDGRDQGTYANNRLQMNLWMRATVLVLFLMLPTCGPAKYLAWGRVGDTVAEKFTPDQPGDHWKFDKGGRLVDSESTPDESEND
jgi:hypothetical protein